MKTELLSKRSGARKISVGEIGKGRAVKGIHIRRVLVPIDFSPPSLQAIEFVLPLLKQFGADLHLVHVFEPDYPLASMAALPLIIPEMNVGKRVRGHLKNVAKKYLAEVPRVNIHAIKGRPFEEICRLARDESIDLIVTATRGNTGLKHLTLGSTAERIVRYAPCPVLVAHPSELESKTNGDGKGRGELLVRKVLVPIDFSECSAKGLDYAKALAKKFGAELILLNSVAPQYYLTSDEYARYDLPLLMQQAENDARTQMRDLVAKTDWEGVKVKSLLQTGHAGAQICARALEDRADLIVTSTHGRTGLKHILIGSTAEYVVRHASCPVLVVPSHERPLPAARTNPK